MSTEMQTKVQASPAQNFTPVQTGILQRKCALCNIPGLVEDSKRDKEKLTFQSSSTGQAGTTTVPRFGHDFSRVSVHSTVPGMIQTKLKINKPGDLYEQEADRVADVVMRMPESELGVQRQVNPEEEEEEEEEPIQAKPLSEESIPLVQRQVEPEEEELQTKATSSHLFEANPNLESKIQSLKGGGRPLSENDRAFFEPRFGHDFSQLRMHTDTRAAESARAVNARAYTMGQNVVFGEGQYAPGTSEGRRLMAHELTHVVQQGNKLSFAAKTHANVNLILRYGEKKDYPAPEPSFEKIMSKGTKYDFFPVFVGPKAFAAFNSIKKQLKMDPRDPEMTIELLSTVKVTKPNLKKAFDSVLNQLRLELHYKTKVKEFFQGLMDFTQNLQNSYQNRFMKVTKFLHLKDENIVRIFMARLISEGFESIGEIGHPAAKIIGEALKVIWDTYSSAKAASSANKVTLSLIDQLTQLDAEFNKAITQIEMKKNIVLHNWTKLQEVGKLTWPANTEKIRKELGRGFEIDLWKKLLSTKWKHMTSSNSPTFSTNISHLDKYIMKHPHYYITYKEGKQGLFWKTKGYYITYHWLGSGSHPFTHSEAPKKLAIHLFQTLGIPRKEVFENWNLPHQTFIIPTMAAL